MRYAFARSTSGLRDDDPSAVEERDPRKERFGEKRGPRLLNPWTAGDARRSRERRIDVILGPQGVVVDVKICGEFLTRIIWEQDT